MRFLIILLLAALVQSSFLPINLVLVFLVCKVMMTKQELIFCHGKALIIYFLVKKKKRRARLILRRKITS